MTRRLQTFSATLVLLALAACATTSAAPERVILSGQATTVAGTKPAVASGMQAMGGDSMVPVSYSGIGDTAESMPSGAELAYVTGILSNLNQRSFQENREYCGYMGRDAAGNFMSSAQVAGTEDSCTMPDIPAGMITIASYHTHGTYSPEYASEFPTTQDVSTDQADNVDGYIATPGGRLWHVDSDTMTVRQLCGRACLPQDPSYVADDDGPLQPSFTYAELERFENGY